MPVLTWLGAHAAGGGGAGMNSTLADSWSSSQDVVVGTCWDIPVQFAFR
jgi:hypothetical protein